ncbi:unnamed protein product [Caenorhabditis brenneri]
MNNVPSLYELSFDVVTECFEIGILPTNHVAVTPEINEQIFDTVMRIREYSYDDHAKALIEMFKPKKLQLNFENIQKRTFDEIKKLEITALKIRNFEEILKYQTPETEQGGSAESSIHVFCIHRFLHDILSREAKEGLRVLDIWGDGSFGQTWMEGLSSMFPNLEVLNICRRKMSDADFASLCNDFPNLRTLNICGTKIKNLHGLAKLQKLEYLDIDGNLFETKEDIKDLFELKRLKQLVIGYIKNWNADWYFEKPHPELETLKCDSLFADNEFLRRILPKLPNLKTVVVHSSNITQAAAHPRISLYTDETVEAMMKKIGYYRAQKDWSEVDWCFFLSNDIYVRWTEYEEQSTPELTTLMVNELEAVIRDFKLGRRVLPDPVDLFLAKLPKIMDQDSLNADKLSVLNMILMYWGQHLKRHTCPSHVVFKCLCEGLNRLTEITENFNADKICSLTMRSIIYGGGFHEWEQICAVIMDRLMDRMDLSSEYYKHINFRKLHKTLITIKNSARLLPERRASAASVLGFVELFM